MSHARWKIPALLGATVVLAALAGCTDDRNPTAPELQTFAATVGGPVITVTNTDDGGPGSLRDAIAAATDGTTIDFDPGLAGQTINAATFLRMDADLTIEGPAAGGITISGSILSVPGTRTVTFRNLSITGSSAFAGAGILNSGHLTLENTTVYGNDAFGGNGGGILNIGALKLINSTVSGNHASEYGGGIYVMAPGTLILVNSTVANNAADIRGGGIVVEEDMSVAFENSIIANNTAGTDANCFLGPDLVYVFKGRNLSNDSSCDYVANPDYVLATPFALGPLADNGGPSMTHALPKFSPAVDAGLQCTTSTDQRYVARPQGLSCDLGAYEFDSYTTDNNVLDASGSVSPNSGAAIITGTMSCPDPASIDLTVTLTQPLRQGRVDASVQATNHTLVDCNGATLWSIALTPTSGAFSNGTATVSAVSASDFANYVLGSSIQGEVKLFWNHK